MTVDNLVTQLYKKIMVEEGLKGSNSSNHKVQGSRKQEFYFDDDF